MSKNLWTIEEEDLCKKLLLEGKSYKEISNIICRTEGAIRSKRAIYFKDINTSQIYKNSSNYKAIYQDYNWCYQKYIIEGLNHEQMAKEAVCTKRVIEKWCQEKHKLTQKYRQKNKILNDIQKDLIIGSLLGDGHIDKRETQPIFIVVHAENQKDYLYFKYEILKDLCNKEPSFIEGCFKEFTNGKIYWCQNAYRICTRIYDIFLPFRKMSNTELLNNMNDLSFSIWMLDDGYRSVNNWQLCIAEYTPEETELIIKILKNKYNINAYLKKDIRYLGFIADDSRIIDEIILKNIPNNLDVIKYKITENNIRNKQKIVSININNEEKTLRDLSEEYGIAYKTLCSRYYRGQDILQNVGDIN